MADHFDPTDAVARAWRECPEAFADAIARRLELEVMHRARWVPLTSAAGGLVFASAMYKRIASPWLGLWLTALLGATGLRTWFNERELRRNAPPSPRILQLTTIGAVLSGVFWGMAPLLPLVQPDSEARFFAAAVVAGVVAGASISYASAPRIMLAVSLSAIPPTIWAFGSRGDTLGWGAALMVFLLGVLVIRGSSANRRVLEAEIASSVLLERERERVAGREQLLRLGADALPERIAYLDPQQRFVFVNRRYVERFGQSRDKIMGATLASIVPAAAFAQLAPHFEAALAGEDQDFEVPGETPGDPVTRVRYIPDRRDDGTVRGMFAITTDMPGRAPIAKLVARNTSVDPFEFRRRATVLHQALRRTGGEHAVCSIQLDELGSLRAAYGPGFTAAALHHVEALAGARFSEPDQVGRSAADQIVVLLVDRGCPAAAGRCEELLDALRSNPLANGDQRIELKVSIGITALRSTDPDIEGALRRAGEACGNAQRNGTGIAVR